MEILNEVGNNSNHNETVESEAHPNHDELSDTHNIILGSLTLVLALATFVIGFITWLQDRRSTHPVVDRVDPEGQVSDIPLAPIGQSLPAV